MPAAPGVSTVFLSQLTGLLACPGVAWTVPTMSQPLLSRARMLGFTMVELVTVLSVLAVIAALMVPTYQTYVERTQDNTAAEVLRDIATRSQALVVTKGADGFSDELVSDVAAATTPDANAEAAGVSAAQAFAAQNTPSHAYGEVSVGVTDSGATLGLAMVSLSGNCVTAEAGLRETVDTEIHGDLGDACRGALAGTDPGPEDPGPPPAPDLCAAGVSACPASDRAVNLTWDAPAVNDVDHYEVWVRRNDGGPSPTHGDSCSSTDPGGELLDAAATSTSFSATGLSNGVGYCFWVITVDRAGQKSDPSDGFLGVPFDDQAPTAPTNLVLTAQVRAIELSWDAATDDFLAGYRIYRSNQTTVPSGATCPGPGPAASTFELLATTTGPDTSFIDQGVIPTGLDSSVCYWYRVTAYDSPADNESAPSDIAGARPLPGSLGAVALTATGGVRQVALTWTHGADPFGERAGYNVYRTGTALPIATLAASATSYVDTGRADGTSYTYEVRPFDSLGVESASPSRSATTVAVPDAPTAVATPATITVSFAAPPPGATSTQVDIDGSGTPAADTSSTSWIDGGLANSVTRSYRVRSCANYGVTVCTGWSPATTATTPPGTPVLTGTSGLANHVPLSWTNPPNTPGGDETRYDLQRRAGIGPWTTLSAALVTSFDDTTVSDGVVYEYRVRAVGPTGVTGEWAAWSGRSMLAPPAPAVSSMTCPLGRIHEVQLGLPTNNCSVNVSAVGGEGSISVAGRIYVPWGGGWQNYSGPGVWTRVNVLQAGANWFGDVIIAESWACNEAGCTSATPVTSLASPRPAPWTSVQAAKVPVGDIAPSRRPPANCFRGRCLVRVQAFFASGFQMRIEGPAAGTVECAPLDACRMYSHGNFAGVTSWHHASGTTIPFFMVPNHLYNYPPDDLEKCNPTFCQLDLVVPYGTVIYSAPATWLDSVWLSGYGDGWCRPGPAPLGDGIGEAFGGCIYGPVAWIL